MVFLTGCVEIEDGDIWWHLRTGQLIAQRREIPHTDWFTYTNPDSPWIDLHWGFQLIAAALWALGGTPALVLAKSFLGTVTFALCLACRRPEWPWRQAVACWLPSILIFSGRNQVRPEMISFLFLAATLAVLFHERRRTWLVWLLPVIQALWINVHALFILGLLVWFCFVAGAAARRLRASSAGPAPTSADFGRWAIVTLLMLAAALANPYGLEGATFPFTLLERIHGGQRAFFQAFAGEFNGLGEFISHYGAAALFGNLSTAMLLLVYALGAISLLLSFARGRGDPFHVLIFVAFGYLAWQASRNSPLFALVGGVVVCRNFAELLEDRKAGSSWVARAGRVAIAAALGFLLIAVPTDILSFWRPSVSLRLFGLGEVPGAFAHDAARFLSKPGMPRTVYADDLDQAAVYIFHNGPERRVFADPRLEVNTVETLSRHEEIARQFARRDPAVLENLTRGLPPAADGKPETPALLFDIRVFRGFPGLLEGLRADARFQAVYMDRVSIVFLDRGQAQRMRLPAVPEEDLDGLEEELRK